MPVCNEKLSNNNKVIWEVHFQGTLLNKQPVCRSSSVKDFEFSSTFLLQSDAVKQTVLRSLLLSVCYSLQTLKSDVFLLMDSKQH